MPGPAVCANCSKPVPPGHDVCPVCGPAVLIDHVPDPPPAEAAKPPPPLPAEAAPSPAKAGPPAFAPSGDGAAAGKPPAPAGRPHSPAAALVLGVVVPGAGQAYNGHPFKALFFLFTTPLFLPWIWSLVDAYRSATRLVSEGGRYGRGGWVWVFLQAWMAFNLTLLVLVVLTLAGVLT